MILDAVYERRAPFNPIEVVAEVAELMQRYRIVSVTGDKYAADFCTETFASNGIRYQNAEHDRSAIYLSALPLFTSGRVRLLDNGRLVHQFVSLERRVTKFGRDRVDHPASTADDMANSAAGALVLAAHEHKPGLIRSSQLLHDGAGVPLPRRCEGINAVVWPDSDGLVATTVWSVWDHGTPQLILLDFTVAQIGADTVRAAYDAALDYVPKCNMVGGGRLYVPKVLAEQYAHLMVDPIPQGWLLDINALRLAVGTQTAGGMAKLSTIAAEKSRGTALAGSLEGWMKQPDALAMSFMLGVALSLRLPVPR